MPLAYSAPASSNQDLSEHRNTGELKLAFHFCRNFFQYTMPFWNLQQFISKLVYYSSAWNSLGQAWNELCNEHLSVLGDWYTQVKFMGRQHTWHDSMKEGKHLALQHTWALGIEAFKHNAQTCWTYILTTRVKNQTWVWSKNKTCHESSWVRLHSSGQADLSFLTHVFLYGSSSYCCFTLQLNPNEFQVLP